MGGRRSTPYTSGMLKSYATGTCGYYEARIKGAPLFPGVCPAFWLYSRIEDQIHERAGMSQKNPTPADEFAEVIVREVTAANSPAVIRHGKGSAILPALGRLPVRIRDRILSRRFKLERLQ